MVLTQDGSSEHITYVRTCEENHIWNCSRCKRLPLTDRITLIIPNVSKEFWAINLYKYCDFIIWKTVFLFYIFAAGSPHNFLTLIFSHYCAKACSWSPLSNPPFGYTMINVKSRKRCTVWKESTFLIKKFSFQTSFSLCTKWFASLGVRGLGGTLTNSPQGGAKIQCASRVGNWARPVRSWWPPLVSIFKILTRQVWLM